MNMAAMVIGAVFEKTENNPSESIIPRNRNMQAPRTATTAAGKRSMKNPVNKKPSMTRPIIALCA
jgi:hypothetical protein